MRVTNLSYAALVGAAFIAVAGCVVNTTTLASGFGSGNRVDRGAVSSSKPSEVPSAAPTPLPTPTAAVPPTPTPSASTSPVPTPTTTTEAGSHVSGRVDFSKYQPPSPPPGTKVYLFSYGENEKMVADLKAEGLFRFDAVPPGKYNIQVGPDKVEIGRVMSARGSYELITDGAYEITPNNGTDDLARYEQMVRVEAGKSIDNAFVGVINAPRSGKVFPSSAASPTPEPTLSLRPWSSSEFEVKVVPNDGSRSTAGIASKPWIVDFYIFRRTYPEDSTWHVRATRADADFRWFSLLQAPPSPSEFSQTMPASGESMTWYNADPGTYKCQARASSLDGKYLDSEVKTFIVPEAPPE